MQKQLAILFAAVWRRINGTYLWYVIWWFSAKFFVDVHGAVYDEFGRVLLVRTRLGEAGVWSLPGGIVKRGETWEAALNREVMEETGCSIRDARLLQVRSGYRVRVEAYFSARLAEGDLRIDPWEVLEAGWFAGQDLPVQVAPEHREVISASMGR